MSEKRNPVFGERRASFSRRVDDSVARSEFHEFQEETRRYRCEQGKTLKSIHTALFAKNEDNEHGQAGLMTTAKNIDHHITAVCNIAKWLKHAFLAASAIIVAGIGAAKALGIM